jgi:hypothetical protein
MELINSLHYCGKGKARYENVQVREREASCKETWPAFILSLIFRVVLYHWFSKCALQIPRGPRGQARGSARLFLSSYYKLEGNNILFNNCNILQNPFIWNNGILNVWNSKLFTGICTSYIVVTAIFVIKRLR